VVIVVGDDQGDGDARVDENRGVGRQRSSAGRTRAERERGRRRPGRPQPG
jgi:hypothetical protein